MTAIDMMTHRVIVFLDITYHLIKTTQRFGDSILSPSSGGTQSIELVPISGHQHKTGYISQAQHEQSARVKTKTLKKNSTHMRPSTYVHVLFHGYCFKMRVLSA
jgi:hypothetical protein